MNKHSPAEQAYQKFAAQPLTIILGGVDRASFIAGYDTARKELAPILTDAARYVSRVRALSQAPFDPEILKRLRAALVG